MNIRFYVFAIGFVGLFVMSGCASRVPALTLPTVENHAAARNPFAATYIAKHKQRYYIAAHQERILTSKTLNPNIGQWKVVDDSIFGIHSFAFYEDLIVADHTNADCVRVYRIDTQTIRPVQDICDLPERPHRTVWDSHSRAFWMLSSDTQTIHKFELSGNADSPLRLLYKRKLSFLNDAYTRSMTIIGDLMYFVSGPSKIIAARYRDDSFDIVKSFPAPEFNGQIIDVFLTSDKWWYITTEDGTGRILRMRSLDDLESGNYEDITAVLPIPQGVWPYYLNEFDGKIWVPYNWGDGGIFSFQHARDGTIINVEILYNRPL